MSYRALFMADVHLTNALPYAKPLRAGHPLSDRLFELAQGLRALVRDAAARGVRDVWVLGDFLDRRLVDGVTLYEVARLLRETALEYGVRWWLLPGNHEVSDASCQVFTVDALAAIDGVKVLRGGAGNAPEPDYFDGLPDFPFYAAHYQREEEAAEWLLRVPRESLVFLHQTVIGARVGESWQSPLGIAQEALAHVAVLAGHFHTPQEMPGALCGCYLGAPVQHSFEDAGETRCAFEIEFSKPAEFNLTALPLPGATPEQKRQPRFHVLEQGVSEENLEELAIDLANAPDGDYVKLVVSGAPAELKRARSDLLPELRRQHGERLRAILWEPRPRLEKRARAQATPGTTDGQPASYEALVNSYLANCDVTGYNVARLKEIALDQLSRAQRKAVA